MEKPTPLELDTVEKIVIEIADGLKELFNLFERKEKFGDVTWKTAAHVLGENLLPQPPDGYYNLSPSEWLEIALKKLDRDKKYATLNNDSKESCHKDVETERQPDGTKFHCLYLHKHHVLFLDWLLNHTYEHTNMPNSLKLANEIKDATSAICRKIELEEDLERNDKKCCKCNKTLKFESDFPITYPKVNVFI